MGGRTKGTHQDAAKLQEAASAQVSVLWAEIRGEFSARVRRLVDAVVAAGGMTYLDVLALGYARFETTVDRIKRLERRPKTASVIAELESICLQHLKGLRATTQLLNPNQTPNTGRHLTPDVEAKTKAAHARIAEAPGPDTGDDLVN